MLRVAPTRSKARDRWPALIHAQLWCNKIASNVLSVAAAAIPLAVVEHTKALILDSSGCALAAGEEPAFARAARVFAQLGGNPDCTVIGSSQRVNLPQAVLLNGILIRALDLNDAYIGPGQMGHPSDNIAVALSVGEKFRASGLNVIASVALGYEIYCRMQDIIPVRGTWDHTTASALAAPLIAGRLMGLNAAELAHTAALSATHGNTLAVVRTGQLANSKAPANAMVASQADVCCRGNDRTARGHRTRARAEHRYARRGKIRSSRATDRRKL